MLKPSNSNSIVKIITGSWIILIAFISLAIFSPHTSSTNNSATPAVLGENTTQATEIKTDDIIPVLSSETKVTGTQDKKSDEVVKTQASEPVQPNAIQTPEKSQEQDIKPTQSTTLSKSAPVPEKSPVKKTTATSPISKKSEPLDNTTIAPTNPADTVPVETTPSCAYGYDSELKGCYIEYTGNGQGPSKCKDGMVSHSAGRGTCSGHGGIAR